MRILAIDVGLGTQDILLYDSGKNIENCIKVIIPSRTQILAKRIRNCKKDLFVYGETMGGGAITFAILNHLKKGYRVVMTESSAKTIRDDLDQVRRMGIEIVKDKEEIRNDDFCKIETKDIDFEFLKSFFESIDEDFDFDFVGIAVQDHGFKKGVSDRIFRFQKMRELIEKSKKIGDLAFKKPPSYYTRMCAVYSSAKKYFDNVFIVDTKLAAIVGAVHDSRDKTCIAVDIGNGHTLIGAIRGDEILGVLEHHTRLLTRKKLENYIVRFANGEVTNEEVFSDNGHGCYIKEAVGFENVEKILVTGPKRNLIKNSSLNVEFASPAGDVMITGALGIVDIILNRIKYDDNTEC